MTADPETVPDGFVTVNLNERETTENQSATKHKEWEEAYAEGWEDCRQEHIKMRHVTDCARVEASAISEEALINVSLALWEAYPHPLCGWNNLPAGRGSDGGNPGRADFRDMARSAIAAMRKMPSGEVSKAIRTASPVNDATDPPILTLRQFLRCVRDNPMKDNPHISAQVCRLILRDWAEHAKRLYDDLNDDNDG